MECPDPRATTPEKTPLTQFGARRTVSGARKTQTEHPATPTSRRRAATYMRDPALQRAQARSGSVSSMMMRKKGVEIYFPRVSLYGADFVKGVPQGSYPFSCPSVSLFDLAARFFVL